MLHFLEIVGIALLLFRFALPVVFFLVVWLSAGAAIIVIATTLRVVHTVMWLKYLNPQHWSA